MNLGRVKKEAALQVIKTKLVKNNNYNYLFSHSIYNS
jgi:hypothetical protein